LRDLVSIRLAGEIGEFLAPFPEFLKITTASVCLRRRGACTPCPDAPIKRQ
jgi:hypothetical protein